MNLFLVKKCCNTTTTSIRWNMARIKTDGFGGWVLVWFGFEMEEEDARKMVILASRQT